MEERIESKEVISTNIDPEGNLELIYKVTKIGLLQVIAFPLIIFAMAVTITVSVYTNIVVGGILFIPLFLGPLLFLGMRKEKITIVKNEGIKFNSRRFPFREQQIPYSSIDSIRAADLSRADKHHDHEVIVYVRGRSVVLTNSVSGVLAKKIMEMIVAHAPQQAEA